MLSQNKYRLDIEQTKVRSSRVPPSPNSIIDINREIFAPKGSPSSLPQIHGIRQDKSSRMSNNVHEGCTSYPRCLAEKILKNSSPSVRRGQLSFSTRFAAYCLLAMLTLTRLPSQFYSWYIYPEHDRDFGKSISSAEYVDDVNTDPVVIIDGLTKVKSVYTRS